MHDYEPIANKLQVLTYNYSSGSTGEPKIMMYPNKVALDRLQFTDNFGYINALGYRETWRLLKQLRSLRIGKSHFNGIDLGGNEDVTARCVTNKNCHLEFSEQTMWF